MKTFKIKKNPTKQDLQASLDEMEIIVSTNSVDTFLTDGIIQSIKIIEGVSSVTQKYNVTGMAELLKANPQFHSLCKQLYIKHGTFSQIEPEYQLLFLVATTAYICRNKNANKHQLDAYLDAKV